MSEVLAAVTGNDTTVSTILAPTTGLGVGLYALYLIIKLYREGRREQVLEARNRETKERQRADDAERERDRDLRELQVVIHELERELAEVRDAMIEQRRSHDQIVREERERQSEALTEAYRRLEVELRVSHRLMQWCIEQGCGLPPDLDPARPDMPPRLGDDVEPRRIRDATT